MIRIGIQRDQDRDPAESGSGSSGVEDTERDQDRDRTGSGQRAGSGSGSGSGPSGLRIGTEQVAAAGGARGRSGSSLRQGALWRGAGGTSVAGGRRAGDGGAVPQLRVGPRADRGADGAAASGILQLPRALARPPRHPGQHRALPPTGVQRRGEGAPREAAAVGTGPWSGGIAGALRGGRARCRVGIPGARDRPTPWELPGVRSELPCPV